MHAAIFSGPDSTKRLPGAHVRDVNVRTRKLRQRDVTLDHDRFRDARDPAQPHRRGTIAFVGHAVPLQRRIFTVIDNRHAEHSRILERPPHQQGRRHRPPVIRERDAASGFLRAKLRELFAPRAE